MKNKLKFFKTVPGTLLIIAFICAIAAGGLWYRGYRAAVNEETRIIAELEHKEVKRVTPEDFRVLFKRAEKIDSGDQLYRYVMSNQVAWIVSQADPKDSDTVNLVGRYKFDITGRAQFFKTSPRKVAVARLEAWAQQNGAETNNVPVIPEPSQPGVISFIKSGQGILMIVIVLIFGAMLVWSIIWGPMSGLNRFARGRELKPEKNNTRFSDIAGMGEKLDEVREVVDILIEIKDRIARDKNEPRTKSGLPLLNADDDEDTAVEMIKGILMTGSPGTGKTLTAMAIAGEAGVPFYQMNGSDFVELYVGVGSKRVRALFATAKRNAPSIVCIDEIDAVGKKRSSNVDSGGADEYSQTVDALLTEIDGFDKNIPVVIIGTTNRPDILDPALLRPGRLTRHIHIDPPEKEGRKAILELYAKKLKRIIAEDVSFEIIAKETPGLAGDHLRNLVNEANILARRRKRKEGGRKVITKADFEEALERVNYGPEKKSRIITPEEKRRFAKHEAGHARVGYRLEAETGEPIHKASIIQRDNIGGHVQLFKSESPVTTKTQLIARMALYAAGFVAEEVEYGGDVSAGASYDMEYVTFIATNMVREWLMGDIEKLGLRKYKKPEGISFGETEYSERTRMLIEEEIKKLTLAARAQARKILEEDREEFLSLEDKLMEKESIYGAELREILEGPISAQEETVPS